MSYLTGIHEVGDEPVIAEDDGLEALEVLAAGQVLHRLLVLHQAAQEMPGPGRLTLTPQIYYISDPGLRNFELRIRISDAD
jgi:hypothetical protein